MADSQSLTLNPVVIPVNNFNPIAAVTVTPGALVVPSTVTAGEVVLAKANALTTTSAVCFVSRGATSGLRCYAQYCGPLDLSTADWDAQVTGQHGGLTPGVAYYLSSTEAGKMVTMAPTDGGTYALQVGVALSATTMMVQIYPQLVANS